MSVFARVCLDPVVLVVVAMQKIFRDGDHGRNVTSSTFASTVAPRANACVICQSIACEQSLQVGVSARYDECRDRARPGLSTTP